MAEIVAAEELQDRFKEFEDPEDEEEVKDPPEDSKETEDAEKTVEELAEEEKAKIEASEKDASASKDEEIANLRSLAREQKRSLENLESKLAKTTKVLEDASLITEEDKAKEAEINALQTARMEQLETLLDVMELNPKWEDVREVCSQQHFDEIVDLMAQGVVKEHGGKFDEVRQAIEQEIWTERNPYKYIYGIIKEYHPTYRKPATTTEEKKVEDKAVPKIPGSLQDMPGGAGNDKGPWTAAKIDAMEESELGKVPSDIYNKWLRGELK